MLTDLKARKTSPGDKPIADGTIPGLRLEPGTAKGEGKWILRFVSPVTGKRRDMGLGRYPEVGISTVRIKGLAARELISAGKDPIDERGSERAGRRAEAARAHHSRRQRRGRQRTGARGRTASPFRVGLAPAASVSASAPATAAAVHLPRPSRRSSRCSFSRAGRRRGGRSKRRTTRKR